MRPLMSEMAQHSMERVRYPVALSTSALNMGWAYASAGITRCVLCMQCRVMKEHSQLAEPTRDVHQLSCMA
jgi:hypothetical protein